MDSNGFPIDVSPSEARRRRPLAIAVVGGALAALLGFGAVATTLAADPSPSPSAGTQAPGSNPGGGTHRGGMKGNCPNMGNRGGSGGAGNGTTPTNPSSPSPSESPSDVPESL